MRNQLDLRSVREDSPIRIAIPIPIQIPDASIGVHWPQEVGASNCRQLEIMLWNQFRLSSWRWSNSQRALLRLTNALRQKPSWFKQLILRLTADGVQVHKFNLRGADPAVTQFAISPASSWPRAPRHWLSPATKCDMLGNLENLWQALWQHWLTLIAIVGITAGRTPVCV